MKSRHPFAIAAALALTTLSPFAAAQAPSRSADASLGIANLDYNPAHLLALVYQPSPNGAPVTASVTNRAFHGVDSQGEPATMLYSAIGWAASPQYGRMQTLAAGSLRGSYYSPDNPPYFDASQEPPVIDPDGVPDYVYSQGTARFTDILSYGGFSGQRDVRYIFHISGNVEGDGFYGAILQFEVSGHTPEYWFITTTGQGPLVVERGTEAYRVTGQSPQTASAAFAIWYEADLRAYPEGSDIEGVFDFSSTAVLARIEMFDTDGNPVTDWTVESASGTVYPGPGGPIDPIFADGFETLPATATATAVRIDAGNCAQVIESAAKGAAVRAMLREKLACGPDSTPSR